MKILGRVTKYVLNMEQIEQDICMSITILKLTKNLYKCVIKQRHAFGFN